MKLELVFFDSRAILAVVTSMTTWLQNERFVEYQGPCDARLYLFVLRASTRNNGGQLWRNIPVPPR